ncbi:MAG: TIGR02281 family clan AA aspartic protease, partial [Betaproteobacteria bacterium HGW-Betaproteobacteria-17]
ALAFGPFDLRGVPASLNPGMGGDQVLLGMSVLKHLEFTQRGDTLILRAL